MHIRVKGSFHAMKKYHIILGLLAIIALGCNGEKKTMVEAQTDAQETASLQKEPDSLPFPVYIFDELEPLLNNKDNTTYIVNFWATWCVPCVEELPFFEQVYAEQKDNGVKLILVSLDMRKMWTTRLAPFVKKKNLQGEVVILNDPRMNDWIPKVDTDWGGAIPATLIYNKNKRAFYERGFTYEELNTELHKFLKP